MYTKLILYCYFGRPVCDLHHDNTSAVLHVWKGDREQVGGVPRSLTSGIHRRVCMDPMFYRNNLFRYVLFSINVNMFSIFKRHSKKHFTMFIDLINDFMDLINDFTDLINNFQI